jgi:hypothetical protein
MRINIPPNSPRSAVPDTRVECTGTITPPGGIGMESTVEPFEYDDGVVDPGKSEKIIRITTPSLNYCVPVTVVRWLIFNMAVE